MVVEFCRYYEAQGQSGSDNIQIGILQVIDITEATNLLPHSTMNIATNHHSVLLFVCYC